MVVRARGDDQRKKKDASKGGAAARQAMNAERRSETSPGVCINNVLFIFFVAFSPHNLLTPFSKTNNKLKLTSLVF